MKGSIWFTISPPDLLLFPFSPNMPKRGSTEGWVQARWMDACCSCRISSWGALRPDREWSLPLTGRSFKATRQDDRWHQSSASHGCPDLELHFSNVETPVIELLLYYFFNNKKNNRTFFPPGIKQNCGRQGRHARIHVHVHLTKALIYRLNVSMSFLLAAALLLFCQHKISGDNIYLKEAVRW